MRPTEPQPRFVVCVKNIGYPAALELRRLYQVVAGPAAAKHRQLRVINESGEDYLALISLLRGPFDDRRRKKGPGA